MSSKDEEQEAEAPDEWTVLAETYTSVLVPSFAPIYQQVADRLLPEEGQDIPRHVLDFGCGPGEPSFTLLQRCSNLQNVVGVDSTNSMLDIAEKRYKEEDYSQNRAHFHHVRRDITMNELKKTVGGRGAGTNLNSFDCVVSTFVLMYVDFARRVELVNAFLEMAPKVIFTTWGEQSKVGVLRALKTFGRWKGGDKKVDILDFELKNEDDGTKESPTGSFTMSRQGNFQAIVDKVKNATLSSFETRTVPIKFPSVRALLSFLPMPTDDSDCQAAWKLLKHWNENDSDDQVVTLGDGPDQELCFPSDVVFCEISLRQGVKRSIDDDEKTQSNKEIKSRK